MHRRVKGGGVVSFGTKEDAVFCVVVRQKSISRKKFLGAHHDVQRAEACPNVTTTCRLDG